MSGAPGCGGAGLSGRRFAFLSYQDFNLYRFRLPIMRRLVALGARVYAVAPAPPGQDLFRPHGIDFIPFELCGDRVNPLRDAQAAANLRRLLTALDPDVLQTFMLKPNLVGGWIARRANGTRVISTVTGLGRVYEADPGIPGRAMRWGVEQLLRRAFDHVDAVVFQNGDDRDELLARHLCRPEQTRVIRSSGVDLEEFSPAAVDPRRAARLREAWGIGPDEAVVTMVARLLPSKGVREFAAAGRALAGRARLVLVGPVEEGGRRAAVGADEIVAWQREGVLIAPGQQRNIQEWLAASDVYALPSYYREGVPRSVLEALAMRLPVVTTRMPGCRETVVDGHNGFLVPPRDVGALVAALGRLVEDASLRERMGAASRELAARRFASDAVAEQHLALYRELLAQPVAA